MADKKAPADGWPVISGDYIVGDPESPVAVTTLASHIEAELSGAAIAGPCKTENLGIEKVVANIISNPNIRFLILAGAEVQGHITGQSFQALHENGADPDKKKIIGATGAIPFVENVPLDGIERFQQQLEVVDLIDFDGDEIKDNKKTPKSSAKLTQSKSEAQAVSFEPVETPATKKTHTQAETQAIADEFFAMCDDFHKDKKEMCIKYKLNSKSTYDDFSNAMASLRYDVIKEA